MRSPRSVGSVAAVLVLSAAGLAGGDPLPDTPIASGNVTVLGTIPEVGAVGGQVRVVDTVLGPRRYFLMTSARGVSVYDVVVPEAPVLVSHLPLPHWENEDVDFGEDVLIVSQDPEWFLASSYGAPELAGGLYLIDISNLPALGFAYVNPATGNRWTEPVRDYGGHTTTCVRSDCSIAWVNGSDSVSVVDLSDPATPVMLGTFASAVGGTHDTQVDEAGIAWTTGSGGVVGYDTTDPLHPTIVAGPYRGLLNYHHNSWRPDASLWEPRTPAEFGDPSVRPGELLMITEEEIYGQLACQGQGRFQTERVRDTDELGSGAIGTIDRLDTWTTELQVAGIAGAGALCSAHYFEERDGIVAIAWYEQGLRFLDVSEPRDIRQVGYLIAPATVAWNVRWIGPSALGGEILYTMDGTRGIDIVRFDPAAATVTVEAPILPSWLEATPPAGVIPHPVWGYACRLAA